MERFVRYRSTTLATAVVCAVLLTACSGGASNSTSSASGGGVLTVLQFQSYKYTAELTKQFEQAHPGVTVQYVNHPYAGYEAAYAPLIASKSGADVMMFKGNYLRTLASQGALVKLNDLIGNKVQSEMVGFPTGSLQLDPSRGIFGMPQGLTVYGWYYNKTLAKQVGLDPEKPFSTYEELSAACDTAKQHDATLLAGGNAEGYLNWWYFTLLWGAVATAPDTARLATDQLSFTDPTVQATTQRYVDLVKKGCFAKGFESLPAIPDSVNQFQTGKQVAYGAALGALQNGAFPTLGASNVGLVLGVGVNAQPPRSFAADAQAFLAIPSFSKNRDLAWQYINFMTSRESQQAAYDSSGSLPNITGVKLTDSTPPALRQAYDAVVSGLSQRPGSLAVNAETAVTWPTDVLNEYNSQLQQVLLGGKSVSAALQAVQEVSDRSKGK